ncbi:MAG: small conductance mechanosensitive channel, partial [Verrucomicrobiales bacterium]
MLKETEGVVSDPAPQVLTVALADFANILRARWWTKPEQAEVMLVQDRVITSIESALTENA